MTNTTSFVTEKFTYQITLFFSKLSLKTSFEIPEDEIFFKMCTKEEKQQLLKELPSPFATIPVDCSVQFKMSADSSREVQEKVDERSRVLRRILTLCKGGSPHAQVLKYELIEGSGIPKMHIIPGVINFGSPCILSEDDILRVQKMWLEYKISQIHKKTKLALDRLIMSSEKRSPEDRLIDYIIGLETLFMDDNRELNYRLSLRCACFLGDSSQRRKDIFKFIKGCYDLRSMVLHQGDIENKDVREKTDFANLGEVDNQLSEYLRQALYKILFEIKKLPDGPALDELLWNQ